MHDWVTMPNQGKSVRPCDLFRIFERSLSTVLQDLIYTRLLLGFSGSSPYVSQGTFKPPSDGPPRFGFLFCFVLLWIFIILLYPSSDRILLIPSTLLWSIGADRVLYGCIVLYCINPSIYVTCVSVEEVENSLRTFL